VEEHTAGVRIDLPIFGERSATAGKNGCDGNHIGDTDEDESNPGPKFHVSETNSVDMDDQQPSTMKRSDWMLTSIVCRRHTCRSSKATEVRCTTTTR